MFQREGAYNALKSAYWSKALALTDVYSYMPQKRKTEWSEQLRNPAGKRAHHSSFYRAEADREGRPLDQWEIEPLPEFDAATVRSTIESLLLARTQFFAERVDGIFRALSGDHVTNIPEGFGKRMIIAHVITAFDTLDHDRAGYIHDLRVVIAKFMGREEPKTFGPTSALIDHAKHRRGEWVSADGGALRIRVYKVGTAHLEVHPDMAWRLNAILANLHPLAIPAKFRTRPARKAQAFQMMCRPLPFAVLAALSETKPASERVAEDWREKYRAVPMTRSFGYSSDRSDKAVMLEAERVIESIGGVRTGAHFTFDYEPGEVLAEIITSGSIPDRASHQYYATPRVIGSAAVALAEIGDADRVLEPQAGNGDLAALLPRDRTLCVEISALRCSVLRARGLETVHADFLAWAETTAERLDCIVMNPPYSEGLWSAHTKAAATLVQPGGRLVSVLPASARNTFALPGFMCDWSRVYENEFAGTGIAVAILRARRASR